MPLSPRLPRRLAVASLFAAAIARPAHAHAILEESLPPEGGSAPAGMVAIHLRYNSRIDRARSRLILIRPDRTQTDLPIVPSGSPDQLSTSAVLATGAYTLRWHVLATDGHLTRGDLRFAVTEP